MSDGKVPAKSNIDPIVIYSLSYKRQIIENLPASLHVTSATHFSYPNTPY